MVVLVGAVGVVMVVAVMAVALVEIFFFFNRRKRVFALRTRSPFF